MTARYILTQNHDPQQNVVTVHNIVGTNPKKILQNVIQKYRQTNKVKDTIVLVNNVDTITWLSPNIDALLKTGWEIGDGFAITSPNRPTKHFKLRRRDQ